jgi:dCTP deaminase
VVHEGYRRLVNDKKQQLKKDIEESMSGVLTKKDIQDRLALPKWKPDSLVITPQPNEFDRDSLDLSLGNYFFIPRSYRSPCFIPGISNPLHLYHEQYVPLGSYLVLPAHHTVLGATLEYIKLPSDTSGEILTKSSWARTFISIETAPWIHPLYRGCLTLEIANVSNTPVILYPGIKLAQLILLKTMRNTAIEDKIEGTYIGPVRPEPAELKTPGKSLSGKEKVTYPVDEYFNREEFRAYVVGYLKKLGYKVTVPSQS